MKITLSISLVTVSTISRKPYGALFTMDQANLKYLVSGKIEVVSGLRAMEGLELYMDRDSEINITHKGLFSRSW